jgi:hypothetical protein
MCKHNQKHPNPRDFIANLGGPLSWTEKISLAVRNNLLKIMKLQNCCGNSGEPGC